MKFRIGLSRKAEKQIDALNAKDRERVYLELTEMQYNPRGGDYKKLKDKKGHCRRRSRNWRIIFYYSNEGIVIAKIEKRNDNTYK